MSLPFEAILAGTNKDYALVGESTVSGLTALTLQLEQVVLHKPTSQHWRVNWFMSANPEVELDPGYTAMVVVPYQAMVTKYSAVQVN